ncbi:MAG: hypothetical protein HY842_12410 [Bacteroidetes bacterium]|nr:hypothetical protein [Bacteroidota bacterium]
MFKDILTFIIGAGIGAWVLDWLRIKFEKRKLENLKLHDFKEKRYKAILLLMEAVFDFDKNKPKLHSNGRTDLNTKEDLTDELKTEWKNSLLYASDEFVKRMSDFVKEPSEINYWKTALEMRKDLYGIKTRLSIDEFKN